MNLENIKHLKQMLDREEITLKEFEKAKKEIIAETFDIEAFCSKLEEREEIEATFREKKPPPPLPPEVIEIVEDDVEIEEVEIEDTESDEDTEIFEAEEEVIAKVGIDTGDSEKKLEKINIQSTKRSLTQSKFKKYRGYNNLNLDELSLEIKNFFRSQKFGWLGEAKPQVFIKSDDNKNKLIKCFTAKTLVRTWGNSSETAINVLLIKGDSDIEVYCGFSGNKSVLSGSSVFGAVMTGGVSLIGNAASAVKDKKLIESTMQFVDEAMKDLFGNNILAHIPTEVTVSKQEVDPFEQIEKLSVLKEKGILTEDEFNNKKNEILNRI